MTNRLRSCAALLALVAVVVPAGPAAATASCRPDAGWAQVKEAWAGEVLALTNAHRATLGLGALAPSASLTDAATWKAAHMAGFEYMSHDDPAPPVDRAWDQRIRDCGYSSGAGENIAYGYRTPDAVFQGWLNSAGHRRNIENPSYRVIGVGAAVTSSGTPYWAQVFGLRTEAGDAVHEPPPPTPPPTSTAAPAPTPVATPAPASSSPPVEVPLARDDSVTVPEDRSARIAPLSNDSGIVRVVGVGQPSHGTVTLGDGNELLYVPDRDFHGPDSFTYSALDPANLASSGTVTVVVEPRNDHPAAEDDEASVRPRRGVRIAVLANDADADGDSLRVKAIVRAGFYGKARVEGDRVVYRAKRGTAGRFDRVSYRVSDGNGGSALATLEVRIRR